MPDPAPFHFRSRYRGVVVLAAVLALVMASYGLATFGLTASLPLLGGGFGLALVGAYLASPLWRLRVTVDDAGLEVGDGKRPRFRLAWSDIVQVVASDSTHTCFVNGGAPTRSLLVPGVGAPAPYSIERSAELYALIVARAPRVVRVATLETASPQSPQQPG